MKIFSKIILSIIILFLIMALAFFTLDALTKPIDTFSNPDLKFIKSDWTGNPVNNSGQFIYPEFPHNKDFTDVIKWQLQKNPQKKEKENDTFRLKVENAEHFLNDKRDGMIWIGHATFLFRINGKLIITDPIFTVPSFTMKRLSGLPVNPKSLKNIHYILLSHDHYDHLNKESFKMITKNNPNAKILTGLELGKFIQDWAPENKIQEAGWYQQYNITTQDIKITFLPSRHWSTRGIGGMNKRLWGAFMIQTDSVSIYFGGDSGFGSHFAEVKDLFGMPDYSIIGIGAYKPEWFMGPSHASPADGLRAAGLMGAKNFIPMHYGTFDLSDEPLGEPYREVHRIYAEKYSAKFILKTPNIGEVIYF